MTFSRRRILFIPVALMLTGSVVMAAESQESVPSEQPQNTLVVYYSHSGTSAKVAELLAARYNAQTYEIKTVKPYNPSNARDDRKNAKLPAIRRPSINLKNFDRVILVSPVWGYSPSLPMKEFLQKIDLKDKEVIVVVTGYGRLGNVADQFEAFFPFKKFVSIYRGKKEDETSLSRQLDIGLGATLPRKVKVIRGIEADPTKPSLLTFDVSDQNFAKNLPRTTKFSQYAENYDFSVKPTDPSPGYLSIGKNGFVYYNGILVGRLDKKIPHKGISEKEVITVMRAD